MNRSPRMIRLMARPRAVAALSGLLFALVTLGFPRSASARPNGIASFASGNGNLAFLVTGALLPLVEDGHRGGNDTLRALDALGTSMVLCEGLKFATHERRPGAGGYDSFPSGHTTAAFALATTESMLHPRQAPFWYTAAAAIGWSRLSLGAHHPQDVIAGALLGYASARFEMRQRRGLILSPWISPQDGGAGLGASGRF